MNDSEFLKKGNNNYFFRLKSFRSFFSSSKALVLVEGDINYKVGDAFNKETSQRNLIFSE